MSLERINLRISNFDKKHARFHVRLGAVGPSKITSLPHRPGQLGLNSSQPAFSPGRDHPLFFTALEKIHDRLSVRPFL
jgi:hypothetical protein